LGIDVAIQIASEIVLVASSLTRSNEDHWAV
jgi:hypothetical protein